ncbi:hypothetical protein GGR56DRAFT_695458 [Xylariaceae sp. FL0804]|nr:hypothetical protein GGR56DRAFT_695458 [Xylariaceae sp. FL0804]
MADIQDQPQQGAAPPNTGGSGVFVDDCPTPSSLVDVSPSTAEVTSSPRPELEDVAKSRPDLTAVTAQTHESGSSSGSGSTVKRPSPRSRKNYSHKPDALSFLDSDSPTVTADSIRKSVEEASQRSPESGKSTSPSARSTTTTSSGFRDDASDAAGDHETDRSTSPERSVDGDHPYRPPGDFNPRIAMRAGKHRHRSYGTPEMPRGHAQHPHISPSELTPRVPSQNYAKHLPRAEKLPLTGYELLASRLSTVPPEQGGPTLRPLYRRFETLNHRILLHLQDEICELEEQLHRLDTADTQNRRLQNCILPASRRAEYLSGGELQWHKTDVLGKIGFKLEQYNRVLSSFQKTQSLPAPTLADIHEYRGYLVMHAPIADAETRFLDATDDLLCVGELEDPSDAASQEENDDAMATPLSPRNYPHMFSSRRRHETPLDDLPPPPPPPPESSSSASPRRQQQSSSVVAAADPPGAGAGAAAEPPPVVVRPAAAAAAAVAVAAVMLPVLTFAVVPNYVGRLTVALLFGLGVLGALFQGGAVDARGGTMRDLCICAGFYGGGMAVLAAVI